MLFDVWGLADETSLLGTLDEVEDVFDFRCYSNLVLHTLHLVGKQALAHDDVEGAMEHADGLGGESTSSQAYQVEAAIRSRLAGGHGVGQDVLAHLRTTAYHGVASYAAELMNQHMGTQYSIVVDDHFTCQFRAVADDAAITHDDIVSHVHALHEQVVAAYHSLSFGLGAAVDGHVLAYFVVVAHLGGGFLAHELQVLWYGTDDGSGEDDVALADARPIEHGDTVHQGVVVTDDHVLVNVAKGANLTVLTNLCFRMDVC